MISYNHDEDNTDFYNANLQMTSSVILLLTVGGTPFYREKSKIGSIFKNLDMISWRFEKILIVQM